MWVIVSGVMVTASMDRLIQASVHYSCLCHTGLVRNPESGVLTQDEQTCLYVCVGLIPHNVIIIREPSISGTLPAHACSMPIDLGTLEP